MTSTELRQKFLAFFEKRGHQEIPSAPLVPENDPSVLFTTAGMHPLVPYLLGQPHPLGKRLVDYQKCLRTDDIDEVGDTIHHTFFEMLGNWSLGDYFKQEAIAWSYEFLTEFLNLDRNRLYITCFTGDGDAPRDNESAKIWQSLGIPSQRIFFLGKNDNWWGPVGETGPAGPDTEIHYDTTQKPCSGTCQPGCNCGRFSEIWNNVFMEYNKTAAGKYEKLSRPNVDTGMGLERALAITNGLDDDYLTDLWQGAIQAIESLTKVKYLDQPKEMRVIADHIRAAVFAMADGVIPANKERGYIVRRLIRRATLQFKKLGVQSFEEASRKIADIFIDKMAPVYPELTKHRQNILETLSAEVKKFSQTLGRGLKEFEKLRQINGSSAFDLYQTYGFPVELTAELAQEKGLKINLDEFKKEFTKHQELSRTTSAGMFKGGLADQSEQTTKLHTATHLLHQALRTILGNHVIQKGSHITAERLRFDFSHPNKLTMEEIQGVESLINEQIQKDLSVSFSTEDREEALKSGALAAFDERYPERVKVYKIGDFSKEICGGPHVGHTLLLGQVKIEKEESASAGVRRIYATISG